MSLRKSLKKLLQDYGILKKEEMISYEAVYEPDTRDAHDQWMSKEEVAKACENFNKNLKSGVVKSNLFHQFDTDGFSVVDTWIHKELDVTVDATGEPIKAGTWLAKIQFHDERLWELKKSGVLGGVSFGGVAEVNKETGEIKNLSFDGEKTEVEDG